MDTKAMQCPKCNNWSVSICKECNPLTIRSCEKCGYYTKTFINKEWVCGECGARFK